MTYVFDEKEKAAARREKSVLFWTWFAVLVAALVIIAVLVTVAVYQVEVNRNRDNVRVLHAVFLRHKVQAYAQVRAHAQRYGPRTQGLV